MRPAPAACDHSRFPGSPLFHAPSHRARADRHRHGRRVSRGRAARAARGGRPHRSRRRSRRGGARRAVRRGRRRRAAVGSRRPVEAIRRSRTPTVASAAAHRGLGARGRLRAAGDAAGPVRRWRRRRSHRAPLLVGELHGRRLPLRRATYCRWLDALFAPTALPTIIPRLIVLCLLVALVALAVPLALAVWRAPARRRIRQGQVWRLLGSPLSSSSLLDRAVAELWSLIRGAAPIAAPPRARTRTQLHRSAAREPWSAGIPRAAADRARHGRAARRRLRAARRPASAPLLRASRGRRRSAAEAFDLAGVGRDHVMDALAASLTIPVATDPHLVRLPAEGPWRGETHRMCDRPGSLERLLEEVRVAGAEQVIVVSAAPPAGRPARTQFGSGRPAWSRRRAAGGVRDRRPARRARAVDRPFRGTLRHPAVAQSARPAGLPAASSTSGRTGSTRRGARRSRLRRRVSSVRRAGRCGQRRADRDSPILIW